MSEICYTIMMKFSRTTQVKMIYVAFYRTRYLPMIVFIRDATLNRKKIGKEGEISPNTCIMFISETPGLEIISGMSIKLCEKG